jgi:hypothetical protein
MKQRADSALEEHSQHHLLLCDGCVVHFVAHPLALCLFWGCNDRTASIVPVDAKRAPRADAHVMHIRKREDEGKEFTRQQLELVCMRKG